MLAIAIGATQVNIGCKALTTVVIHETSIFYNFLDLKGFLIQAQTRKINNKNIKYLL